jgi:hypothetical protein
MPGDTLELLPHAKILETRIEYQDAEIATRLANIYGRLEDIEEALAALLAVVRGMVRALKCCNAAAGHR